jgi:hypothetical protein
LDQAPLPHRADRSAQCDPKGDRSPADTMKKVGATGPYGTPPLSASLVVAANKIAMTAGPDSAQGARDQAV